MYEIKSTDKEPNPVEGGIEREDKSWGGESQRSRESVKKTSESIDAVRMVQDDNDLKSSDWTWKPGLG